MAPGKSSPVENSWKIDPAWNVSNKPADTGGAPVLRETGAVKVGMAGTTHCSDLDGHTWKGA